MQLRRDHGGNDEVRRRIQHVADPGRLNRHACRAKRVHVAVHGSPRASKVAREHTPRQACSGLRGKRRENQRAALRNIILIGDGHTDRLSGAVRNEVQRARLDSNQRPSD